MKDYILANLVALDQQLNTLTGGSADETLSSRAFRSWYRGKLFGRVAKPVIDGLFFFQKDHCKKAYLSELHRHQLPPNFYLEGFNEFT